MNFGAAGGTPGGFSFGGAASTPSTGFSFGNTASTANKAGGGGFSFGNSSTPAASASSTGLSFGTSSATPAASTGFSFGSTTKPAGNSLFGANPNPTLGASTGTGFGAFGSGFSNPGFNSGNTGNLNAAGPGLSVAGNWREQKFDSLPQQLQNFIVETGLEIRRITDDAKTVGEHDNRQLQTLFNRARQLETELMGLQSDTDRSKHAIDHMKERTQDDMRFCQEAHQVVLKRNDAPMINTSVQLPSQFFCVALQRNEAQIKQYAEQIDAMQSMFIRNAADERGGGGSDQNTYGRRQRVTPHDLKQTMQFQAEAFFAVSGQVATLHEHIDRLKDQYLQSLRNEYRGSAQDDSARARPMGRDGTYGTRRSGMMGMRLTAMDDPFKARLADRREKERQWTFQDKLRSFGEQHRRYAQPLGKQVGAVAGTAAGTLGFGAFGSSALSKPATGFGAAGFGAAAKPATGFGAPATGGFSFGSASTPSTTTGGFGLSAAASTTTGGFGFGAPAAAGGLSFGAPAAAAATTGGLSFGSTGGTTSAFGGMGGFGSAAAIAPKTPSTPRNKSRKGRKKGGRRR